ncbi:hypothetical protein SEA_CECE_122 [Microbacterium phage Cece]|nr:hypothetical protein SEA_CECE_122 [Microbacterium phage Cece]
MTITPHPELPGWYLSSHGDWAFDLNDANDSDIRQVEQAIAAWIEWRDFLVSREKTKDSEPLV